MENKSLKYKINIEKDNNVVTFAEFDKMEVAVHLALDLHKVSNIRHTIRVLKETETIISFYAGFGAPSFPCKLLDKIDGNEVIFTSSRLSSLHDSNPPKPLFMDVKRKRRSEREKLSLYYEF